MRPVISYDDITLPYHAETSSPSSLHSSRPPPNKRQKWANQKSKRPSQQSHPDSHTSPYIDPLLSLEVGDTNAEVQGQELTHEDIWDDSALIAAWNAATEEYEAYNGPQKGWKAEQVHKSPLWYNMPSRTEKRPRANLTVDSTVTALPGLRNAHVGNDQEDSTPLDFNTFVPSYNPSLELPLPPHFPGPDYMSRFSPGPQDTIVDEDEAFMRALGATYWGGYWTAVYHCRKSVAQKRPRDEEIAVQSEDKDDDEVTEKDCDEDEDGKKEGMVELERFVSTQR